MLLKNFNHTKDTKLEHFIAFFKACVHLRLRFSVIFVNLQGKLKNKAAHLRLND